MIHNQETIEGSRDIGTKIPGKIPERRQLSMLQKLGLFLDRTSVPQHHPPQEVRFKLNKNNIAAIVALEDWNKFSATLEDNPVTKEVGLALQKFAIAGDLDGFWSLRHRYLDCIYGGW
jgi:hypothetical protein